MATTRSPKSPSYPTMSLSEAIVKIEAIYRKERTHPVHRDVLVKHIGYGTWNGASIAAVMTLSRYGLLEQVGNNKEQYRISDDGIAIVSNFPERSKIIQRLAFMPAPFSELHQYYGDALPSDQNIKMYLVRKGYNDKIVDGIIHSYRDTIEFVNVETEGSNVESQDEKQESPPMQTQSVHQASASPNSAGRSDYRGDLSPSSLPERGSGEKVWSFDLSEDCSIKMVLTGHVTKEALENLKAYIDISIKAAPKASVKQPLLFEEEEQ